MFVTEPAAGASPEVPHEEGILVRKHERDGDKKAGNRSWDKVFVVLHGSSLSCYKDQKHAKSDPNTRIHHEPPMELVGATCDVATDYTKRPHVFRVRLVTGSEYLFQAKDSVERDLWIGKMNSVTGPEGTSIPSRSQTLPARTTEDPGKEEHKKRGFFTLKKK